MTFWAQTDLHGNILCDHITPSFDNMPSMSPRCMICGNNPYGKLEKREDLPKSFIFLPED